MFSNGKPSKHLHMRAKWCDHQEYICLIANRRKIWSFPFTQCLPIWFFHSLICLLVHLSCLFLPSHLWTFHSPLWALKSLTSGISVQELTDLNEFDANSTFLAHHLCFDCSNKRKLPGHLRITMLASATHTVGQVSVGIQSLSLGHHCHHHLGFPFGNPIFSTQCIHHCQPFQRLSGLDAEAKLSDPTMIDKMS